MPSFARFASVLLFASSAALASTDGDRLTKQIDTMPKEDDAHGASAIVQAINESTSRSKVAKHFADRRQYDLLTVDLQDRAAKLISVDAQKAFAAQLPRLPVEAQTALCFGLKNAPPNLDVDAAALKLLDKADNKLKVAVLELLSSHRD
jgi:hypothetical protein